MTNADSPVQGDPPERVTEQGGAPLAELVKGSPRGWFPVEVVDRVVEEAILASLAGRFLRGTVLEAVAAARAEVARLRCEQEQAADRAGLGEPVLPECPISCLHLPVRTYNALTRRNSRLDTSSTAGDVHALALTGELEELDGIGLGNLQVIEGALRKAGFNLQPPGGHHHSHVLRTQAHTPGR
ncbi:hypothetical protein J4573_44370 [Actinomadura barringtoniae]|uniref:RNA polymerase alpha subunit C-terminal domain-containing protein n=1 Tax=Actinomadura barringtoniae TaxID=1427535 RepID=A0A939PQ68_9ACTN|nr:hypothetical protein [Actinomadura barringtoniae]MBO2454188.1 hypothetical protein [Actinomadura barringtoniae]